MKTIIDGVPMHVYRFRDFSTGFEQNETIYMIDRKFFIPVWNEDLLKYEMKPFDVKKPGKLYDVNRRELMIAKYVGYNLPTLPKFIYVLEWTYWISGGWSAGWNRKAEDIFDTCDAIRNYQAAKEAKVQGKLIEPVLTMRNRGRNFIWDDTLDKFVFQYADKDFKIVPSYQKQAS